MKLVLALSLVTVTTLALSSARGATAVSPKVIYGDDNRREIGEVQDPMQRQAALSTLAIIPKDLVQFDKAGGYARIVGPKYGEEYNLCWDEPYSQQPIAANCSASLVGEDLIATAGHCVTPYDCKSYQFVFGYQLSPTAETPEQIPEVDIYSCKKVLAHGLNGSQDYALVQLDRPVTGRRPLSLQNTEVRVGDEVYVIGHPGGLPMKLADGAQVRRHFGDFFNSNLDAYGGSSGSAVFNSRTHEVIGLLVRGETDFIYDSERKCFQSNRCPDTGCRGEDVTAIRFIQEALDRTR